MIAKIIIHNLRHSSGKGGKTIIKRMLEVKIYHGIKQTSMKSLEFMKNISSPNINRHPKSPTGQKEDQPPLSPTPTSSRKPP
jgi:hypothetical protein